MESRGNIHTGPPFDGTELQKQVERYRAYITHAPLAMVVADRSGRYLEVNPTACQISGYEEAELLSMRFTDLLAEESQEAGREHFATLKEIGRASGELCWVRKDGSKHWCTCEAVKLSEDRFLAHCADITDRKAMEKLLQESQQRQKAILDTIPDPAWLKDQEGRFLAVNAAWCRFFGIDAANVVGKTVFDFFPDEIAKQLWEVDRAVFDSGQPRHVDELLTDKNGNGIWFETIKNPFRDERGNVVGTTGLARDITLRKQAEETLRASEERFRVTFEEAPIGMIIGVGSGIIAKVNRALCRISGYRPEELVGRHVRDLAHPEDRDLSDSLVRRLLAGEIPSFSLEKRYLRKDGQFFWAQATTAMAYAPDGTAAFALGVVEDITQRKLAEQEQLELERRLLHAQKLESLGILAGGIAHDFNNILAGIMGYADLARLHLPESEPARADIEVIKKAVQRAAGLTRQMLAYAGKGKFIVEPVNLSRVVEDCQTMLAMSVSKKATLTYNLSPALPATLADASQIHQVVLNLVINASEALGDQSGAIAISTDTMELSAADCATASGGSDLQAGTYVRLEVADTGCGIDRETFKKLFDPFFTTKFTGRGLGLAAVHGIVRGHHGVIRVSSVPGHGSTFQVLFPMCEAPAAPPAAESVAAAPWRGHGTVLVVDDEETVRNLASRMVEHAGFTVLKARDGAEAVRLYRQHRHEIVCVVLDLTMPAMNGEETFRELRRISPAVRVILSSGYSEKTSIERFSGMGLAGFIPKPYQFDTMIAKLRGALEA